MVLACSEEPAPIDPVVPEVESASGDAQEATTEEPAALPDPAAAEEDTATEGIASPTPEADPESGNEDSPEKESSGGSLRDRITTTPADPNDVLAWSQATTIEERRANLDVALAKEAPYKIDMHDLGGWILDERDEEPIPDYILALDGKEFIMRGFMMPDIDFEHIRKFHLVRSLYSCCFGAPPQLNEIMRVTLADEDGMEYTYNTLEVRGTLHIEFEMVDGLVEDIFRLENATYRVLDFDDPDAPDSFDATTGFDGVVPDDGLEY